MTYYFAEGIRIIQKAGIKIDEYRPTGGGAKSDKWIQIKADIMGKPFARPKVAEASSLGAAILAGTATGVYSNLQQAVEEIIEIDRIFVPDEKKHNIYMEKLETYKKFRTVISDLAFNK